MNLIPQSAPPLQCPALLALPIEAVLSILFILCMLCLISALLLFLWDINLSLKALWLEIPLEGRSDAYPPSSR